MRSHATFAGLFGVARRTASRLNSVARFEAVTALTIRVGGVFKVSTQFLVESSFVVRVRTSFAPITTVNAEVHIGKVMHEPLDLNSLINANLHVGKMMHENLPFVGEFVADINFILLMHERVGFDGFFFAIASSETIRFDSAEINVVIPPGGELRIDSDAFNVLLNGENAIHLYRGDWIHFARNLQSLNVSTGTGNALSGEVVYVERFL